MREIKSRAIAMIKRILKWWRNIGNCTDCGKEDRLTTLCHMYSSYHDVLVKKQYPALTFFGSHTKHLCKECCDHFFSAYYLMEMKMYGIIK